MLDPDENRFESYLKQFRPLVPEEFPATEIKPARRRGLLLPIWAGAIATMAVLAMATIQLRHHLVLNHHALNHHVFNHEILNHQVVNPGVTGQSSDSPTVQSLAPAPLTMRRADTLLAIAPSYKAAMNDLAFPLRTSVPKDKQSALAILGKEKIKL